MNEIMTQDEYDSYKREQFEIFMELFGGFIKLDKPIRFRETPHMPTKYINELSIDDDFDSYGLARDSILQRLRYEIYVKNSHKK